MPFVLPQLSSNNFFVLNQELLIFIVVSFSIEMDPKLRNSATNAYLKTRNATGFAKLIRSLLPESQEDFDCDMKDLSSEVIGPIFEDICSQTSK